MLSYDTILSDRIGFGKFQIVQFLIVSLVDFVDGMMEVYMGVLLTILEYELNLSHQQVIALSCLYYVGIMVGNYSCALFSGRLGRRVLLIVGSFSSFCLMLITSQVTGFVEMAIIRTFFGVIFGVTLPISQIVVSEIVPIKIRGRFIVLLQFVYILGILYLIGNCFIFLDNFREGNWREMLIVNSIPALLCFIGSLFLLRESSRYQIVLGDFETGVKNLNYAGSCNNAAFQELTEQEIQGLKEWRNRDVQQDVKLNYLQAFMELFNEENRRITFSLQGIFMTYAFMSSACFILMPFLLSAHSEGFSTIFWASASELPAIIFAMLLIDSRKFGRIRLMLYATLSLALISLLLLTLQDAILTTAVILLRFHFRVGWSCLNALPAESYNTKHRGLGVGAAQGIGKLAGSISPFVVFPLFYSGSYNPFILGIILFLLCAVFVYFHPVDKTKQPLDKDKTIVIDGKSPERQPAATANEVEMVDVVEKQL